MKFFDLSFHARSLALLSLATAGCLALAQDTTSTPPTPATTTQPQVGNSVPGYVMQTPPKIDGVIDPEEWKDVPQFEGLVDASNGGKVPYQGTFWLAYDTKYIYFAAKLPDDDPKKIKMTEYRTNVSLAGNDDVAFIIDPFGTLADFNVFQINPRGATNARIIGGRAAKREWVGEIEAKCRITPEGWESEVRIPWTIMKLPPQGVHDLRFNVYRYNPRYGRDTSWRLIDNGHVQDTPVWTNVTVPPGAPKVLQILPYGYLGTAPDGTVANGGLDLKTGITDDLDFAGTINPDFRNIENQVLSIDHSYFERLAGESRPFFLEGGNYFHTSNDAPIFTSQRISAFDAGEKLYGKLNAKTDIAILNTSDFSHQNNFVLNAFNQVSAHKSFRIALSDMNRPDLKNTAYHGEYRTDSGPWTFYYQHAGTSDTIDGKGVRHNPGINYSNGNYGGYFEYSSVTSHFDPRLGFAPQTGFHGFNGDMNVGHNLIHGPIQAENYNVFWRGWDKQDSSDKYLHEITFSSEHSLRNGTDISLNYDQFEFAGFKDHVYTLGVLRPWNDNYRRWSINQSQGVVEGTDYKSTGLNFLYRPIEMMQINASYQTVRHNGTDRQAIISANYDLGSDRSISGRAVMSGDDWNAYVAYRRSGNTGMEYFLILGDPNSRKFKKSLILKLTYPLSIFMGKH